MDKIAFTEGFVKTAVEAGLDDEAIASLFKLAIADSRLDVIKEAGLGGLMGAVEGLDAQAATGFGTGGGPIGYGVSTADGISAIGGTLHEVGEKLPAIGKTIQKAAPTFSKALPFLSKVGPITGAAAMGYQTGNLIQNPQKEMEKMRTKLNDPNPLKRAWSALGNAPATIATTVHDAGETFGAIKDAYQSGHRQPPPPPTKQAPIQPPLPKPQITDRPISAPIKPRLTISS
jgi:hypothetical protein